jgi:hypothetical protein
MVGCPRGRQLMSEAPGGWCKPASPRWTGCVRSWCRPVARIAIGHNLASCVCVYWTAPSAGSAKLITPHQSRPSRNLEVDPNRAADPCRGDRYPYFMDSCHVALCTVPTLAGDRRPQRERDGHADWWVRRRRFLSELQTDPSGAGGMGGVHLDANVYSRSHRRSAVRRCRGSQLGGARVGLDVYPPQLPYKSTRTARCQASR